MMKQRITVEQLNELSDDQKEQLREWWNPQQGDYVYVISEHKRTNRKTAILTVVTDQKNPRPTMTGHNNPVLVYHLMFANDSRGDIAESKNLIPLLSIGQMLEIMHARNSSFGNHYIDIDWEGELADFLWEEVKVVLEDTPTP